ncbi:MAG: MFS transporter, partial [Pseudomonadota bacterium]
PSYIWLIGGFFVCGFHVAFIQVHLPAYLKDNGLPAWLAATSLALVGGFNIIGSFAAGWIGGRWSKKYALSAIYFARSAAMIALLVIPLSVPLVLVFSAVMGLLWLSTVPLTSGLVAQFFGVRYMATLFGFVFFSHQIGAFLGAWMGGKLYALTGNYDLSWYVAIGLGVVAAVAHFPIREAPVERLANA